MQTTESSKTTSRVQAKTEQEQPFFTPSFHTRQEGTAKAFSGGDNASNPTPAHRRPVIQPKLTINEPGDQYEQEADAVADRVMRMTPAPGGGDEKPVQTKPLLVSSLQRKCANCDAEDKLQRQEMEEEGTLQRKAITAGGFGGSDPIAIQRQCAGCDMEDKVQRQEMEEERPLQRKAITAGGFGGSEPITIQRQCAGCDMEDKVQRQEMEEEGPIQAMPLMRKASDGGYTATPQLQSQLNSSKGGGSPLPGPTLTSMSQAFGADFSSVRIHTDSRAAEMSQGIQAKAFTHGGDIYFNRGQYQSESSEGKKLLAHELTHVVQQKKTHDLIQCSPKEDPKRFSYPWTGQITETWSAALRSSPKQGTGNTLYDLPRGTKVTVVDRKSGWLHVQVTAEGKSYTGYVSQELVAYIPASAAPTAPSAPAITPTPTMATPSVTCPPTSAIRANTLAEYIDLVKCAENATNLQPLNMLSALRQLYYGSESWSASKNSLWDTVIPCKLKYSWPPSLEYLYKSLQQSQVVDGKDIGHIFTGLESMVCPQKNVTISKSKFGIGVTLPTNISNELFATWVGDFGSAVGRYSACFAMIGNATPQDLDNVCDIKAADMSDPVKLMQNKLNLFYHIKKFAPNTDIEGDIGAFVIRAAENNIPCSNSQMVKLNINQPVSSMLGGYFFNLNPAKNNNNRIQCFVEIIGGSISNKKITNKGYLNRTYATQVSYFAQLAYANDVRIKGSHILQGPLLQGLNKNVDLILNYFWTWLEQRL